MITYLFFKLFELVVNDYFLFLKKLSLEFSFVFLAFDLLPLVVYFIELLFTTPLYFFLGDVAWHRIMLLD